MTTHWFLNSPQTQLTVIYLYLLTTQPNKPQNPIEKTRSRSPPSIPWRDHDRWFGLDIFKTQPQKQKQKPFSFFVHYLVSSDSVSKTRTAEAFLVKVPKCPDIDMRVGGAISGGKRTPFSASSCLHCKCWSL